MNAQFSSRNQTAEAIRRPRLDHLSNPQLGIWYTERFYPGSGMNNIAATLRYDGELDYERLGEAFGEFIRVNEGVRLRVTELGGEPVQYVTEYTPQPLEAFDFSGRSDEEFAKWEAEETQAPIFAFDADLYRFYYLRFGPGKTGFFVKMHHIISDAWSMVAVGNQVLRIYKRLMEDADYTAEEMPSYLTFVEKDAAYRGSDKYARDKAFWEQEFGDVPEIASIKARRTKNTSIAAARKSFYLPDKLVARLRAHCAEHGKSPFALFLSALAIYISRVTGKDEAVLGVPTLNRSGAVEKQMMGLFVTTVPIRLVISPEDTYADFVDTVVKKWLSVLRHHKYPVYQIMRDIRDRHPGADRLYDVMISYQNAKFIKDDDPDEFHSIWHFQGMQNESLYIHVSDREDDNQILIDYDYLTDIFHGEDIEALHDHFIRIFWHALDGRAAPARV